MRSLVLIVAVGLTAIPTTAATAKLPGPFVGCSTRATVEGSHGLATRPSKCGWFPYHGYGYNTGTFRSIHWSSWGAQSARGAAVAYGVQMGTRYANHVTIGLSHPVTCYGIYRLFTRMTVTSKFGKGRMANMRCSDIEDQE